MVERVGGDTGGAGAPDGDGATPPNDDEVRPAEPADADRLEARLAGHLDPDERVRVAWVVRTEDANRADEALGRGSEAGADGSVRRGGSASGGDGGSRRTVYAVTDRRLLAVEPDRPVQSTPFARRPAAPALALGAGLLVAVLAFLGGTAAASGWTALLLVVTCVGGLALAEHGRQLRRAAPESRERPSTAVTAVGVAVDDGAVVREPGAVVGDVGLVGGEETTAGGDAGSAADGETAAGDRAPVVSRDGEEAAAAGDDD